MQKNYIVKWNVKLFWVTNLFVLKTQLCINRKSQIWWGRGQIPVIQCICEIRAVILAKGSRDLVLLFYNWTSQCPPLQRNAVSTADKEEG